MCFCTREASKSFTALGIAFETGTAAIHTAAAVKEGTSFETVTGLIVAVKTPFSVKEHPKECGFTLI